MKTDTLLAVEGMSCGSCVRHVGDALTRVPGVDEVDVQLAAGRVRVRHDAATALPALVRALAEAGYPARPAA